ncbi:MAG: nucleoside-diphosphate kinase [Candidatus Nanoarchaeia archaeon]|nr:nucleoside-diphosphate kinase [Candidatus Nanoarchaeia archaeon]MDD5588315.1 nucleoside-diphosphate kinase [Candidatus Nanoarchaeia archaeon]
MIERTLILLKPDCIQRGFIGEIITRFEKVGLKIVGMKMVYATKEFAGKHYFDVEKRHGKKVFDSNVKYLTEGPIVAVCLEGVSAIEIIRKMVGSTEPRASLPGTIRGDYSHVSYEHADVKNIAAKNLIHASASKDDAKKELDLWFKKEELHSYKTVHEIHTL